MALRLESALDDDVPQSGHVCTKARLRRGYDGQAGRGAVYRHPLFLLAWSVLLFGVLRRRQKVTLEIIPPACRVGLAPAGFNSRP